MRPVKSIAGEFKHRFGYDALMGPVLTCFRRTSYVDVLQGCQPNAKWCQVNRENDYHIRVRVWYHDAIM